MASNAPVTLLVLLVFMGGGNYLPLVDPHAHLLAPSIKKSLKLVSSGVFNQSLYLQYVKCYVKEMFLSTDPSATSPTLYVISAVIHMIALI